MSSSEPAAEDEVAKVAAEEEGEAKEEGETPAAKEDEEGKAEVAAKKEGDTPAAKEEEGKSEVADKEDVKGEAKKEGDTPAEKDEKEGKSEVAAKEEVKGEAKKEGDTPAVKKEEKGEAKAAAKEEGDTPAAKKVDATAANDEGVAPAATLTVYDPAKAESTASTPWWAAFLPAWIYTPAPPKLSAEEELAKVLNNNSRSRAKKAHASLGVIRLDYDYPPAPGDIDCPDSFEYDVFYRAVPGLSFEKCQAGKLDAETEAEFVEAVQWLVNEKKVSAITGDCGFMMWFQDLARRHTHKPVLMSSLCQLPAITCAYAKTEPIAIFTANSKTLEPMHDLIVDECGVETQDNRYIIVGCQDVPGFEAVAVGGKVDVKYVTPGIVDLARKTLEKHPNIRAFLLECTELPPYSDALREAFGLPVFDAITCSNMFIEGLLDNPRFGVNDWQAAWDGVQDDYKLGDNLDKEDLEKLASST